MRTFFVLGDQLATDVEPWPSLAKDVIILMIESDQLINQPRHLTRVSLYLSAMRRFAEQVRAMGFRVDYRRARTFSGGIAQHCEECNPESIVMNLPRGRHAQKLFASLGIELLSDKFFLTDIVEMKSRSKRPATLEFFQREQRRRLNVLMEGDQPAGGQWNFDASNREPLPKNGGTWPAPWEAALSDEEQKLVNELRVNHPGEDALRYWPRSRAQAVDQLRDALERIIPTFGPHEDAASYDNWHLSHSRLSAALNMGLLHPREVIMAVEAAFDRNEIPLASAEGFIRQVLGWREWVWVLHQLRDDDYETSNFLGATAQLATSRQMSTTLYTQFTNRFHRHKRSPPNGTYGSWCGRRDSNPQPSDP